MNELTALALRRAGFSSLEAFQESLGLPPSGLGDAATQEALEPYLLGYRTLTIRRGDTFWKLSRDYGTTPEAIAAANPSLDPMRLPIGARLRIPLPFPVVPTDVPMTSRLCGLCLEGIAARYPAAMVSALTTTATGRPIRAMTIGTGPRRVLYTAAHHANEWITATLLLKFAEEYAKAVSEGKESAKAVSLTLVPMVNPDGVDLVTGAIDYDSEEYQYAQALAASYPDIPFPSGWKANLLGVDLNLNYPAGWETARQIKFSQGYTRPGPRDYVGTAPFSQRETRALAKLTEQLNPRLVLAFHTQGQVIYWQFGNEEIPGARALGEKLAQASGYSLEDTPYNSSFAGYKDWFIQKFRRPGYTVEAGYGTNPLPLAQFAQMYEENAKIMKIALQG